MKKFVGFVVLAIVVICSCAAQNVAQDAQRIVGTWVGEYDSSATYVFNSNGTGTVSGYSSSRDGNIFWGVSVSGELQIIYLNNNGNDLYTFYLSPDGRKMIYDGRVYQKR